ncbi:MAG: PTS galactosamine/N-acetylgalactosamine transporter subunit IIA [Erysipelotrichaceae bacterium]
MIGLVVTGHGAFASGLSSSLNLIVGEQENYVAVDFTADMGVEELEQKLADAFQTLKSCDHILVCSDLAGGSPFKTAVVVGVDYPNVCVVAGTNLPMLIELSMARAFSEDFDALVNMAMTTGKNQILRFEHNIVAETTSEDGI